MVQWNNEGRFDAIESELVGRIEKRGATARSSHANPAVLFASGPLIAPGDAIDARPDYDVAPTILNLLGLDAPPGLDGRTIAALIRSPGGRVAAG